MEERKRHVGLTIALVIFLALNVIALLVNLISFDLIGETYDAAWLAPLLIVGGALAITGLVGIFLWRRWGFYLYVGVSLVVFAVNLSIGLGASAVMGLVGPVVLYAVLQLGEPKGWAQLT